MSHNKALRSKASTSTQACVRRILATFDRATPTMVEAGAQWYGRQGAVVDDLARITGRSREAVAAVVAQLSPRTRWERNITGAASLLLQDTAPGCMAANVARARTALASADPIASVRGPKTGAFARNLLGDTSAVTIDVWAARVALGDKASDYERILNRSGVYDALAHAYRIAAAHRGVEPTTMQAVCWVVERNGRAD